MAHDAAMYDSGNRFAKGFTLKIAIAALTLSFAVSAQDPRGTLTGRVTDATGAHIAGASVRSTHIDTGTKVSATTNAQGSYEIPFLLPGPYKIEISHAGFKT